MLIGILAVQGAFREHEIMLERLHTSYVEIRQKSDLNTKMDGLILPGGESTAMIKLLTDLELFSPLKKMIEEGMPVFGTCAGLLLLAKEIENNGKNGFKTMNITARRNAYGRQLGSFSTTGNFLGVGAVPMVFIRAPYIERVFENAKILAYCDNKIVAAQEGNQLVTAFHPELSDDLSIHRYFLSIIQNKKS